MKKIIKYLLSSFCRKPEVTIEKAVKHSADKYYKTYKLLEKYGKIKRGASILADGRNIGKYFRQI